jgi:hypothetical protein
VNEFVVGGLHMDRHRLRDGETATGEEFDALGVSDEHVEYAVSVTDGLDVLREWQR